MISPTVSRAVPHQVFLIKERIFCLPRVIQPRKLRCAVLCAQQAVLRSLRSAEGTAVSWGTKGSPSLQPHISSTWLWAQCLQDGRELLQCAASCSGGGRLGAAIQKLGKQNAVVGIGTALHQGLDCTSARLGSATPTVSFSLPSFISVVPRVWLNENEVSSF